MGATKTEMFTKEQNDIANMYKALGHPARVAIIQHLIKMNSCVCNDLVDELGLAQPTVSQHLKELKNSNLIKGTIDGSSVCYCLNKEGWDSLNEAMHGFVLNISEIKNCC